MPSRKLFAEKELQSAYLSECEGLNFPESIDRLRVQEMLRDLAAVEAQLDISDVTGGDDILPKKTVIRKADGSFTTFDEAQEAKELLVTFGIAVAFGLAGGPGGAAIGGAVVLAFRSMVKSALLPNLKKVERRDGALIGAAFSYLFPDPMGVKSEYRPTTKEIMERANTTLPEDFHFKAEESALLRLDALTEAGILEEAENSVPFARRWNLKAHYVQQ